MGATTGRPSAPAGLRVEATGPLTTVQDGGRPGSAALGIGRSGACDRAAHALGNRLVGNDEGAAALEVTLGGLVVQALGPVVVAVTGARAEGAPYAAPLHLAAGDRLALGTPPSGVRTYVAVRGGVDVPAVLGSRSTDLLSGLGPAPVAVGDVLPVGAPERPMPGVDLAPVAEPTAGELILPLLPGPRDDWFGDGVREALAQPRTVSTDSNRIGLRLDGPTLPRRRDGELPSEGLVRGAVQVPPHGGLVVFLADHPVTGGYPVVGYVPDHAVDRCAQARPGQTVRLLVGARA